MQSEDGQAQCVPYAYPNAYPVPEKERILRFKTKVRGMIEKTKRADNRLTVSSFLVNPLGLEPRTPTLKVLCSTC